MNRRTVALVLGVLMIVAAIVLALSGFLSPTDYVALVGAVLAGTGGIISAWAGLVKARHDGAEDCEQKLRELRAESERFAEELHGLRIRKLVGE